MSFRPDGSVEYLLGGVFLFWHGAQGKGTADVPCVWEYIGKIALRCPYILTWSEKLEVGVLNRNDGLR